MSSRAKKTSAATPRPCVVCVLPAWNEQTRIARVVEAVPRDMVDEVVVVDDGSSDQTPEVAEAAGAVVVRHGRNRGVGAAIRSGIDWAREHGYEIVVVGSGGGKTPPEQIPSLLAPLLDGTADLVQGSRYLDGGRTERMPLTRKVGTRGYTTLFSAFCGHRVTDASSGFRAFRVSLFDDGRINLWQDWLDHYELEPYMLFQALRHGFRVLEVPVTIAYPADKLHYTKMRAVIDWWVIFRPVVFLRLGMRD